MTEGEIQAQIEALKAKYVADPDMTELELEQGLDVLLREYDYLENPLPRRNEIVTGRRP